MSRGLGDVYKRQANWFGSYDLLCEVCHVTACENPVGSKKLVSVVDELCGAKVSAMKHHVNNGM